MLYTFSQAHYSETDLKRYLTDITENDVVVLWQDGVLLVVKYGEMFTQMQRAMFYVGTGCFSPKFNRTFARKQSSAVNFISRFGGFNGSIFASNRLIAGRSLGNKSGNTITE